MGAPCGSSTTSAAWFHAAASTATERESRIGRREDEDRHVGEIAERKVEIRRLEDRQVGRGRLAQGGHVEDAGAREMQQHGVAVGVVDDPGDQLDRRSSGCRGERSRSGRPAGEHATR